MRTKFVGKWINGFGKFSRLSTILMNKSKEVKRREKILYFWEKHGFEATKDAFDVSRSTLYEWRKKQKEKALEPKSKRPKRTRIPLTPQWIVDEVITIREALPYFGKDKIYDILKKKGVNVSASTIGRIIKRENLPSSPRMYVAKTKNKRKKKLRKPKDYKIKNPGDLIATDTIVIQENNKKKYIITIIDYHSRIAISKMYKSPASKNAKDLLLRMQVVLGVKIKAVNTDNGSEFMKEFEKACTELEIKHFHTYPRTPKMNPICERFNRTIQEEAHFPLFNESIEVWNKHINHYIMQYNFFRPHYSLNYITPIEKYLEFWKNKNKPIQSSMLWTHTLCCFLLFFMRKYPSHLFLT